MRLARFQKDARERDYKARSSKARDWARLVAFLLIMLTVAALFTDRTTGPAAQAKVLTWIDGLEAIREMIVGA